MSLPRDRVAVVGAGVIGLSTAVRLAEAQPEASVEVIADAFEHETTSSGAAGLWEPYKLSDTPAARIRSWGADTFDFLQRIFLSTEAASSGVYATSGFQFWTRAQPDPPWADLVPHFCRLNPSAIAPLNVTAGGVIRDGWIFSTLICEASTHLRWLQRRAEALGIKFKHCQVIDLQELNDYDLVMNCTGLGAMKLFGDMSMYPIRGHVIRVKAPWIKNVYFLDEQTYIIPNRDTVVLGGTGDVGNWSTAPNAEQRNAIWQQCLRLMPSLAEAKIEREWVGLRPGRPSVRLELEMINLKGRAKQLPVVHNYGHGGAGLTLAWGCAGEAVSLALQALGSLQRSAKL